MTSQSLPPELGQFIAEQLAAGRYQSEEELVVDAVRVLRDLEAQQQQFREDVEGGLEELERGKFHQYDEQGLRDRFEQLKDRVNKRVDASRENG